MTSLSVSRSIANRGSRRSGSCWRGGCGGRLRLDCGPPCPAWLAWRAGRLGSAPGGPPTRASSTSTPIIPASSRAKASTFDLSRMLETSRAASRTRVDPAVGAVEVVLADDVAEHEPVERHPAGDQLAHRGVALLDPQVARVEAVGLDGDVGLGHEVLVAVERPQRGLLAGGVAVEGEDHLAAELLVVVQEPAQHPRVVVAERGAAGGDGRRHAGQVAGHHVGVALDHDRLRRRGRSRGGPGRCRRAPGSSCRAGSRGC